MDPTAFATSRPLDSGELVSAPIRYPRPSRLAQPLQIGGAKAQHAAEVLGLVTVGDLLEHLPRDRRQARTVDGLAIGDVATVVVEVRSIRSRSVRRRGMRPLVEATVGDATGVMRATFFNQPWLEQRYRPGTRLALHGKYQGKGSFRVSEHRVTDEVAASGESVAVYALLRAVEHGMQAALMAPTETLAEQHFATVAKLMPGELVPVALLTGSTPAARRADTLGKLASGELGLVVGTHALIEPTVEFDRLAVVVVDEQHRFGVRQRAALHRKGPGGTSPHVLHMTATPIPRTLRLLDYGELDHTVIKELPGGRKPIQTFIAATEQRRARAYERVRDAPRAARRPCA